MPFAHAFQTSFWSPTASIDLYPNFKYGFDTLHKRLAQSITENEIISQYIQQRIESERAYGQSLSKLTIIPLEDDLTGLSRCFGVVCAESETSAKEHVARAENVNTTALDPLQRFSVRYSRIIATTKQAIEQQMDQFEMLVKQVEQAKLNYQTRCKAILTLQPTYRPTVIRLGTRVFHERFEIEDWLRSLNETLDRKMIIDWLESENQSVSVMHDLIGLNFIRQVDEDLFEKVKTKKGFFTWNSRQEVYVKEMLQADKVYRDLVIKIDKMRTEIEEALFMHFEEMENLELERIQTLKQVFISLAASLSNTIPRFKETVDNMMLYQETLKPDKDVQMIVEQYRTGQFIPRPILYENYFYGTSRHQLFGVSLEDLSRNEASLIPRFISSGISFIESDISKLENEGRKEAYMGDKFTFR
ncbi:hypothetical protein G6F43_007626 [Rhizopus delemar]|nr:hypothetical protein G6F43_007626 [Rhizopus delemar]